jgi:hypothetical protein
MNQTYLAAPDGGSSNEVEIEGVVKAVLLLLQVLRELRFYGVL